MGEAGPVRGFCGLGPRVLGARIVWNLSGLGSSGLGFWSTRFFFRGGFPLFWTNRDGLEP